MYLKDQLAHICFETNVSKTLGNSDWKTWVFKAYEEIADALLLDAERMFDFNSVIEYVGPSMPSGAGSLLFGKPKVAYELVCSLLRTRDLLDVDVVKDNGEYGFRIMNPYEPDLFYDVF